MSAFANADALLLPLNHDPRLLHILRAAGHSSTPGLCPQPKTLNLALNRGCRRYYEADGVRLYSQQTWREVMGESGRAKVAQFVDQVSQGCRSRYEMVTARR